MPKFFNKKTATVRFHGFNEEKKYQNSKSDIIVSKRLIELIAVTLVLIFILIVRLAYVQLTQADTLEVKLETYGSTTYTNDAPRGEIYDRNYTKIMGNQNVICVDFKGRRTDRRTGRVQIRSGAASHRRLGEGK